MRLITGALFVLMGGALMAGKPVTCTRYPATFYIATGTGYGITGDAIPGSSREVWFDGVPYTKYQDGVDGVEAYVNGGSCAGTVFLYPGSTRKVTLVFQNQLNNGASLSGPPLPYPTTVIGRIFLRGFSFPGVAGDTYTTMLPPNFNAPNREWGGGGIRYEPMTSDFLADNPDFPTYPEMNTPCGTSAAEMKVLSPAETEVTPTAVSCSGTFLGNYTGPITTLLLQAKGGGPALKNFGQYGMNFKFRIVVNGWNRY